MKWDFIEKAFTSLTERMTDYINDKYKSDRFTYVTVFGGSFGSSMTKIMVKSEKYPDIPVCVICNIADNGDETYIDNYMGVKYRSRTFDTISNILTGLYGKRIFLCYEPGRLACTEGSSDDMTFEQYAAKTSSAISFTAIVCSGIDEGTEKTASALEKAVCAAGLNCSGTVYYAADNPDVSKLTGENFYYEYVEKRTYAARLDFDMDSSACFAAAEWTVTDNAQ